MKFKVGDKVRLTKTAYHGFQKDYPGVRTISAVGSDGWICTDSGQEFPRISPCPWELSDVYENEVGNELCKEVSLD